MFELDECGKRQNYIIVVRKLEMHVSGNQKTSYDTERQVDGWKMSILTLQIFDNVRDQQGKAAFQRYLQLYKQKKQA